MIDPTLEYLLIFCLAIFFTSLAFNRQTLIPNLLAGIAWFLFALVNYAFVSSPATTSISWLTVGIGLIFIVNSIKIAIEMIRR